MKKAISLLLAVLLCAAVLAACAKSEDERNIIGKWSAEVDMTEPFASQLGKSSGLLSLVLVFEFKSNGTFTITADRDSAYAMFNKLMKLTNTEKTQSYIDSAVTRLVDSIGGKQYEYELKNGKMYQGGDDSYVSYKFTAPDTLVLTEPKNASIGAASMFPMTLIRIVE